MQKFHLSHYILYPGLIGFRLLSYPGTFSNIAAVVVVVMGVYIINNIKIGKQYYYDLSQVSNFKYGRYYNCPVNKLYMQDPIMIEINWLKGGIELKNSESFDPINYELQ